MIIDLLHNKIVADTISERFATSVEESLIPLLRGKYLDSLLGIQMYEDYISDSFTLDGEWYYPLTVITTAGNVTEWIKWTLDERFIGGVPYAYEGDGNVEFSFATRVPKEFAVRIAGRANYFEGGLIKVRVESTAKDATFLSGKYSQSFIDELARQLTPAISEAMAVEGLENGALELVLTFAPETYMEHTSENVTYRRLLLADKASAPRDFWIKWTRLDGLTAYSASAHVGAGQILFEIGEDVSQKIREKEYRFLLRTSNDKYHNAMGRKNITEWRELVKRAVRKGELIKVERPVVITEETFELEKQLASVLGVSAKSHNDIAEEKGEPAELDEITRLAMEALNLAVPADEEETDEEETEEELEEIAEEESEEDLSEEGLITFEDEEEIDEDLGEEIEDELFDEEFDEEALADVKALEPDETEEEEVAEEAQTPEKAEEKPAEPIITKEELEAKIRAELEAKIRLEYESQARIKAEEEAARLRREHEILRRENERLAAIARREEEERARFAQVQAEKEAKLRAEIEAQARRETLERERLAEAARLALIEEQKKEAERVRLERERLEEERRIAQERLRAEENARIEAERAREAERLRREAAERRAEADRDTDVDVAPKTKEPVYVNNNYTYTSKRVKLLFRRSVDPNITSRIHEIIKATIEYYGKERVYLKIKATIPDNETVVLEFASIPMEEMELLSNIIKVLGNSGLGIAKAIVE